MMFFVQNNFDKHLHEIDFQGNNGIKRKSIFLNSINLARSYYESK